jgi:hypothetical protein
MIPFGSRVARRRLVGWSVGLLALLLSVGCAGSKPVGSVTGKVLYQNKPLRGGSVTFIPADGVGVASSRIGEDGTYSIARIPVGPVKITVETKSSEPPRKYTGGGAPPPPDDPNNRPDPERKPGRYIPIADRYADAEGSGISYEVKAGAQEFTVELK